MAKIKKKRKVKWGRVIFSLILIVIVGFGIYKGISYFSHKFGQSANVEAKHTMLNQLEESIPTVVIDPGHGGIDAGAKKGTLYEKDIALKTAMAVGEALKEKNVRVIYTRTTDEPLHEDKATDLKMRAQMSKTYKADFYVSIHVNDFDGNTKPSGFEIYVKNEESQALASSIGKYIEALHYSQNRGILDGSDLAVLRENTVPSVLVELGYIKDADYEYLSNDQKLQKLGEAISQGLIEQLQKKLSQ